MTQTGVNLVAMLAVERCHRPNACAFVMLTSHFLGDVPLPIVLGLIKDTLAPSCTIGKNGEFVDKELCKEQQAGVRKTLAMAYSWVIWSLVFFELARRFSRKEIGKTRQEEINTLFLLEEDNGAERESTLQYYHSKFRPPQPQNVKYDEDSSLSEDGRLL
jgi:hypothetical protein